MLFPRLPTRSSSAPRRIGRAYDLFVFDRAVLVWLHFALAFVAAFIYSSTFDHSHLRWWGRVGIYLTLQAALSWVPYLISGVYSWHHFPSRQLGFWLFVLVLLAGTVAVACFYLSPVHHEIPVLVVVLGQTAVYIAAASVLLGPEIED